MQCTSFAIYYVHGSDSFINILWLHRSGHVTRFFVQHYLKKQIIVRTVVTIVHLVSHVHNCKAVTKEIMVFALKNKTTKIF